MALVKFQTSLTTIHIEIHYGIFVQVFVAYMYMYMKSVQSLTSNSNLVRTDGKRK